ncbi:MAG: GDP-mannose 4,6-dehydratase [Chlamydiia bacterium]|nr:GDP-mannose 4,6-dehydratase [Chlamydiia bacterium]
MTKKRALITGITGQDGAYLTKFLLEKGYEVHGLIRRSSCHNTFRIEPLISAGLQLHMGDLTDSPSLFRLISKLMPDELYNLGAQSDVAISFEVPEFTADVNALGPLRLLEAVRQLNDQHPIKYYQASSSELFGKVQSVPQNESTPFYPRSPYGVAKLYAYWITVNYRESYNLFACNGILFNHESPLRGENFVTRKITRTLALIAAGKRDKLYLGNLDAKRDWGHASDYIEMQWMILQQDKPQDFVIATGRQYSVRDCIVAAAKEMGLTLRFEGTGLDEKGYIASISNDYSRLHEGQEIVAIDPKFYRPAEVDTLLGDPTLAKKVLGWTPKISFEELIGEMMREDLSLVLNEETICYR